MGKAIELITVQATAPGATMAAFAALTGDSLTVRNSSKKARVLAGWQNRQTGGNTRITSPLLHDNSRGIQFGSIGIGGSVLGFWSRPCQELMAQDTLTVQGTGSPTAGDIEQSAILVQYDDLPGISGNFISIAELNRRGLNRLGVQMSIASVATGQYGAASAINATDDVFKANTDYAIVGINNRNNCTSVGIRSPDWGNLRVGIPGITGTNSVTQSWFVKLSESTGQDCIPVFNSSNKGITLVDQSDDENATSITPVLMLVELAPVRGGR